MQRHEALLVMCPPWDISLPPLGIAYIASYLEGKGISCRVLDLNLFLYASASPDQKKLWEMKHCFDWIRKDQFQRIRWEFLEKIERWADFVVDKGFKVIGFSINGANNFFSFEVAKAIRRRRRDVCIVFGGPSCIFLHDNPSTPFRFLTSAYDAQEAEIQSVVDFIVLGEGEEAFFEIVSAVKAGKEPQRPGIVPTSVRNREMIQRSPQIADLDSLPFPAWDKFSLGRYAVQEELPILFSRGCIFRCAFCNDWRVWSGRRSRSGKNIFEEMKTMHEKFKTKTFRCNDLLFNADLGILEEIADHILDSGLKIRWTGQGVIRKDMGLGLLKKLKKSGLDSIVYGVESLSNDVLRKMGKPFTFDDVHTVLKRTKAAGIETWINLVMGFPTETEENFEETRKRLIEIRGSLDAVSSLSPCRITASSELERSPQKFSMGCPETEDVCERWVSAEGLNTYPVRRERTLNIFALLQILRIKVGFVGIYDGEDPKKSYLLCGDSSDMHEKVCGRDDFPSLIRSIQEHREDSHIVIGLSRHNFFKIDDLFFFARSLLEGPSDAKEGLVEKYKIFPIDHVLKNLSKHVRALNAIHPRIRVVLFDSGLPEILRIVETNAGDHPPTQKNLARLLGTVCEEVFVGPQTIVIDPYHRCNVKCAHCFVHNPNIHHGEEFLNRKLDIKMFRDIVSGAADLSSDEIFLQGDGEPLMHPDIMEMIEAVRERGMKVSFFTNGILLTEAVAQKVMDLGVHEIYCSLPAGSRETYEKVSSTPQGREFFDRILKNMKTLMDLKKARGGRDPYLVMTHVIHSMNFHELEKMAEFDAHVGADAARFYMIRLDNNNKHLRMTDAQLDALKSDLPKAEEILQKAGINFISNIKFQLDHYDKETGAWSKDAFLEDGCPVGWYFCLIPARGDASMCCHLRTVGDLSRSSFKDMWLSDYYRQKRIQAKHLSENKDVCFMNGVKLFDEHCSHCDNHQVLLQTIRELKDTGLYPFYKGSNVKKR